MQTVTCLLLPFLLFVPGCEPIAYSQPRILMDKVAPGVIDRIIVVDQPWNRLDVESILKDFYVANRHEGSLYRLTVARTKESAFRALIHGNDRATYHYTLAEVKRMGPLPGPIAQVLGVGMSAVMMFRENGRYSKSTLGSGSDPTLFSPLNSGGASFRLLAFWLTVSKQTNPSIYGLTVYVRSEQPVSLAATVSLTEHLGIMTKLADIAVAVRGDQWFMESTGFPAIYPFSDELSVPSEVAFRRSPNITCHWTRRRGVTCSGMSFRP